MFKFSINKVAEKSFREAFIASCNSLFKLKSKFLIGVFKETLLFDFSPRA